MATAGKRRGSGPERAFAPDLPEIGQVTLDAEESGHLVRSRRVRAGDDVVLFDGRHRTRLGRVRDPDPGAAVIEIVGPYPDRRPARTVRIAVSLPEGGRTDRMITALAELGVADFAALVCERTPKGRVGKTERRRERWERLAREAAKVNGCSRLLGFHAELPYADALEAGALVLDPDPMAASLRAALGDAAATPWLLIGPEGGFTGVELEAAAEHGTPVAVLGAVALRTETAAVAAAAVALA